MFIMRCDFKNRHANTLQKCITVCSKCHTSKTHTQNGKLWGLEPKEPRLEGATYMNIVRSKLIDTVRESLQFFKKKCYGLYQWDYYRLNFFSIF